MSRLQHRFAAAIGSIGFVLLAGCESPFEPLPQQDHEPGLEVVTKTTGTPEPRDFYALIVNGRDVGIIGWLDNRLIEGLGEGTHEVALSNVAANCEVSEGWIRAVMIDDGMGRVEFHVSCSDAAIRPFNVGD